MTNDEISQGIAALNFEIRQNDRRLMELDAAEGTMFRTAAILAHRKAMAEAEMRGFYQGMGL